MRFYLARRKKPGHRGNLKGYTRIKNHRPPTADIVERRPARVGMHCGPYVVRNIDPEFVQIGCHKIPVDNLRELAAALN